MSSNICPQCNKPMPAGDDFCKQCGYEPAVPAKQKKKNSFMVAGILAGVAILFIVISIFAGSAEQQPQKQTQTQQQNQAQNPPQGTMPQMTMDEFTASLPDDFESLVGMGNAFMDQHRSEMAAACYAKALESEPHNANVRVDYGTCLFNMGLMDKAIANFQQALQYQPEHEIAKFNLGIVYFDMGDKEKAVEWWSKLMAQNPDPKIKTRLQELIDSAKGN